MVRYFYSWTPLVIVGTVVLLSAPWLGLIALMIVALVALLALAALARAIVSVTRMFLRTASRRWQGRSAARQWAAALSPATSGVRRTRSVPAGAMELLAKPPSEKGHVS